ncbi:MAG: MMPL family transporter, partial [Actinomycetota bacterium]
ALSATPLGDRTLIAVAPPGAATDAAALELVRDLRSIESDADVGVTGEAAEEVDLLDSIADRLPAAMVLLVALTLGLLVTFTRAPVVAAKAIVINALSIAAAFGLLVLLVQEGGLAGPLGFDATGGLSVVILLVTFAFAFGLSMDYEVFLLARIREHHERNGDNSLAVVRGLQQSGRVVTQAAGLIVLVFAGFALGDLLLVQQLGVGLALAVVVDATIVRLVLLPALMALLGELNWWNPFGTGSRA